MGSEAATETVAMSGPAGERGLTLSIPFLVPFAVVAAGMVAASAILVFGLVDGAAEGLGELVFLGVAVVVLAGLSVLLVLVKANLRRMAEALAAEAGLAAVGTSAAAVKAARFGALAPLPSAVNEILSKLSAVRREVDHAVAESTAKIAEQSNRLGAVLRDLHEGVIVCNVQHQILLYNQSALSALNLTGALGLGRNLLQIVLPEPIQHAFELLSQRVRDGRYRDDLEGTTAPFVSGTSDGRILLQGRMSLVLDMTAVGAAPTVTGYALTFIDATMDLKALGLRDSLLRSATDGVRQPLANLRAVLETLVETPELSAENRNDFEAEMMRSCELLSDRVEQVSKDYREIVAGSWPMNDIYSSNLVNLIIRRLAAKSGLMVTQTGLPQWLHGDSHGLVILLDFLIQRVHEVTGLTSFDLSADATERWVFVDIAWQADRPIASGVIDEWIGQPLPGSPGGLTAADVLQHHRSELWSEVWRDGYARLRVPLPPAVDPPEQASPRRAPARPEFFDFALLDQPLPTERFKRKALTELSYVVFDCETTGLMPSGGDELVAIAAVRIVNQRILTGETFSALINPGRTIRPESIAIHGITDEMVRDRPKADLVLPQFHAFAAESVLVAHNAAFDLAFLRQKETSSGVRFTNPVLDTMLLSLMLQGDGGDHTLDGIAARLGVQVVDRHTALGDSLLTAAIFLRMVELMAEKGIRTLEEALRAANILVELRSRERAF